MTGAEQRRALFGSAGIAQQSIDQFLKVLHEAASDGAITASEYPALVAWSDRVKADIDQILGDARPVDTAASASEVDAGEEGRS